MSPNEDEEPVAYLGGKAGDAGPPADDQVEGYLGGAAGEAAPEELPALPPAGVSAVYSASDFIAPPPEVEDEPPPSYDSYAADPVAEPAPEQADMEQYAANSDPEPSAGTQTVVESPQTEGSSDFDEPGLPKTISQQDAENIIKRITTKKILPPEVAQHEGPRVNPPAELTPRGSPKLGRLVVILLVLIGGYGAAVYFNDQLAPFLPAELYPFIWYTPPPVKIEDNRPPELTPAQKKEAALRKMVLESEWRAFGFASVAEFDASNKELKAPKPPGGGTGGGAPPGTGTGEGH
ncbi:MAG: hypothetical protein ACAI25_12400 [Planctomycetota bacterium]